MKNILIILVILNLFNHVLPVFGENYYRSNSIGMVFEIIPVYRIDEYDWIIEIIEEESIEKRIMYFKGEETGRKEFINQGNILTINEYKGNNLIHVEQKTNGLIINEQYYQNNVLINEYNYEWTGRQLSKTIYKENKLIIYEDKFILNEHGEIIQIRRIFNDGQLKTSGISNLNHGSAQEWYSNDNEFILYKYSEGKLAGIENWQNGILSSTKIFTYSDSGSILIETDFNSGIMITKIFDSNDKILSETTGNGNIIEKIIYKYKDNLLIQKEIASSGLRDKFLYEYDSDNRLQLERILKDDMLIKEIYYNQGKKILEKLYKDDLLVLIVTYKNGDKINEEYIQ